MASKRDAYYFNSFADCAAIAKDTAVMLKNILGSFDPQSLREKMNELHELEHKGDARKHELMAALVKEFITPLERDDIVNLTHSIDDVTDAIDDTLINIYTNNITSIRPDALKFADLLVTCCDTLHSLIVEFKNFKKSKLLQDYIIKINSLEEEGDKLYISALHELHTASTDALEVIAWREVYKGFEKVCDACEHVADIVELVAIENL
jgi:uncharacterized protein Yka (UPF0111/DUF47 family)